MEIRESGHRSGAQRYLLPAISARWLPTSQTVSSGPAFARGPMPIPRIPCQDGGAFRSSLSLTCLASPCRAGDSRSRPQAAKRWRGTRQRNAPALTGCRWSGTLGFKLAGPALPLTTQPALSAQAPFDAAVIAHEAGDVLPDALVEYGLPRHQTKAETTITTEALDHREPAAG